MGRKEQELKRCTVRSREAEVVGDQRQQEKVRNEKLCSTWRAFCVRDLCSGLWAVGCCERAFQWPGSGDHQPVPPDLGLVPARVWWCQCTDSLLAGRPTAPQVPPQPSEMVARAERCIPVPHAPLLAADA